MKIRVNGIDMDVNSRTLKELLDELKINPDRVAVEVNLQIIKKDKFSEFEIKEGDSVEIVNFVGGG
ncbi:sulfur carrier protein ThiS [Thermodesulfovibrio hydrogeniphilus]